MTKGIKIWIVSVFTLLTICMQAQSFEFGPTLGLNSTWLINPNMLITHPTMKPELTLTGEYGGQAVLKLGKRFGLGVGVSTGNLSQRYDWNEDTLSIITLETFNVPVFIRAGNRFFSETGVQFTAYNKGYLTILDEFEEDVLSTFKQNNIYLFQGIGGSFHLTPHLFLNLSARFGYGLYDIKGVSPQGFDYGTLDEIAAIINAGGDYESYPQYDEYAEYIGYFENAQAFADNYQRFNRTHSFYLTAMGSLVFNLEKTKGSDN